MTPNNGALAVCITTCRVCGHVFKALPLSIPIVGEEPDKATRDLVTALGAHLAKKHGDKLNAVKKGSEEFGGMLILNLFESSDPQLVKRADMVRTAIHMATRRNQVPDAMILDRVAQLGLDPDDAQHVIELMRDLRDLLTEQGRYGPQIQTSPLVIV